MELFSHNAEFKMDVLREVGNIGAGHAATALSRLLDKPIDMAVPKVSFIPFEDIADRVGGAEEVVVAIFLRVEGEAPGNMFFLMSQNQARVLLQGLLHFELSEGPEYSEMELSALSEIGNILAGSYLSSLADLTGLPLSPTVPAIAVDMAGAILSYGLVQFGTMGDEALLIDTTFLEDDRRAEGHFFFIPDPESFERLFRALGVPI
ncbi:chemotaxis protein CheC [Cohnella rhizosphaerae]|uniref:Chemotaxis protein CheC n=1 Tax=Cohnella rhizosphaerae TaxID=1457232 RepID=A0A9X4QVB6_9BACL|nr:chemotaxis protein CheC [Cohnella rhizosphaerae]MDG0812444.1 chemotaxis protein CheC [Cohnella rhizosphaerae]